MTANEIAAMAVDALVAALGRCALVAPPQDIDPSWCWRQIKCLPGKEAEAVATLAADALARKIYCFAELPVDPTVDSPFIRGDRATDCTRGISVRVTMEEFPKRLFTIDYLGRTAQE